MLDEAFTPHSDGVAVAVQRGGDEVVGGVVILRGVQDDAAAQDKSLGRGAGADECLELGAEFGLQFDDGSEGARHGCPPGVLDLGLAFEDIMANHAPFG
jgi:hypothetical protein